MGVISYLLLAVMCIAFFGKAKGQQPGNGAVRLFKNGNTNPNNTNGIVQVYYSHTWGNICSYTSSYGNIPHVVCHQLGYTGGSSDSSNVGQDPSPGVITSVLCEANYLVILQCKYQEAYASCHGKHDEDVQVTCYSTRIWENPYDGMIHLQGGLYTGQGVVRVYCNGEWGTICYDTGFNSYTADTVCTQLGYNAYISKGPTTYPEKIWLANVNCKSTQDCLHGCKGCPDDTVSCDDVANVTCTYYKTHEKEGSNISTCKHTSGRLSDWIVLVCLIFFCAVVVITIGIPIVAIYTHNCRKIKKSPETKPILENHESSLQVYSDTYN